VINDRLMQLAFRDQLLDSVAATTGTTSIAATASSYTRSAGSFVTEGFEVGMEVLAAGFATAGNNGYKIVTSVAAGTLGVSSSTAMSTEAAGGNESIVCGIPEGRAWDNSLFTPTTGRWYIEEDLVPSTHTVPTFPKASAYAENRGLYVLRVFGLSGKGVYAIRRVASAILAQFTPGTGFTLSDATNVRIPSENGPIARQITPVEGGWSYVLIEIPYLAHSLNTVAA
jgi:hypothetical protein